MPPRVLLTGASGFIAAHILDVLLERGYFVVATVRSQNKADLIKKSYPKESNLNLEFALVEDIAQYGAFDHVLKSKPPFDAVIHTASPFHFNVVDVKKDLIDPAVIGTTGILNAVYKYSPSVRRVVVTSSFAAMYDNSKGPTWHHTYSEKDWNPVTEAEASKDPLSGYRASKTFAEKAAWKFMEEKKPSFSLTTICPPYVFGPIARNSGSISSLNTSNQRVQELIAGKYKEKLPETGTFIWADVRDLALAHVNALNLDTSMSGRYLFANGFFSNREICEIVRKRFPEMGSRLPGKDVLGGDYPKAGIYRMDNKRSAELLGRKFRGLEESIVDLVNCLQSLK